MKTSPRKRKLEEIPSLGIMEFFVSIANNLHVYSFNIAESKSLRINSKLARKLISFFFSLILNGV